MTQISETPLSQRFRAVWSAGDYAAVARDVVPTLGGVLVDALRIAPGEQVADVAAGTGNAALAAARAGADVFASDLVPQLLDEGRRRAAEHGPELARRIDWHEADCEALPYPDARFDVVLSCIGAMFAPHHQDAADELVRVLRPGGRLGLLTWTPEGFVGQLFATMKPYVAPPPAGVRPPPLWGDEEHVRTLLGDRATGLTVRRGMNRVDVFATPQGFRDFFKTHYGPTVMAYRALADQPERVAALDQDLDDLARRFDLSGSASDGRSGSGNGLVMDWEYLVVTATRT